MDSDRDISSDHEESGNEPRKDISRHMSESSIAATEEDDDDVERKIDLGPQFTLKEQLEKDKVHLFFSSFQHSFLIHHMFVIYTFVNCFLC